MDSLDLDENCWAEEEKVQVLVSEWVGGGWLVGLAYVEGWAAGMMVGIQFIQPVKPSR